MGEISLLLPLHGFSSLLLNTLYIFVKHLHCLVGIMVVSSPGGVGTCFFRTFRHLFRSCRHLIRDIGTSKNIYISSMFIFNFDSENWLNHISFDDWGTFQTNLRQHTQNTCAVRTIQNRTAISDSVECFWLAITNYLLTY